ncbi:MAG: hypothetical protein JNL98_00730 [Bryobacterales bacterium]|nr:hypothetical protein [Bryobacterales bacterium]
MNAIFQKLNYKNQGTIYVVNAPDSFQPAVDELRGSATVKTSLANAREAGFVILFATKQTEVDRFASQVAKSVQGDALVWIAYPKGSSKKYKCDFNRDTGWSQMGAHGFEPVRQVAIDEDWSALRFRRVEYIKTMTRSFAMTKEGREKVSKSHQ